LDLKIVDFNHYAALRTTPSYQISTQWGNMWLSSWRFS